MPAPPCSLLERLVRLSPALVILATSLVPSTARGELIMEIIGSSTVAGGTGVLEILIRSQGDSYDVSGFGIELAVDAGSGISFTDADAGTTLAPYLFGTLQSPPFVQFGIPGPIASLADADLTPPFFVTVGPDVYGLARVSYSVSVLSSPGRYTISLVSSGTSVSDIDGAALPLSLTNGSIVVAVPEPSSIFLLGTALTLWGIKSWCGRSR